MSTFAQLCWSKQFSYAVLVLFFVTCSRLLLLALASFMYLCVSLQVSEYNMPAWRSGKEDFERRMEPLEQRVSQKLREMFGELGPFALFLSFKSRLHHFCRPWVLQCARMFLL